MVVVVVVVVVVVAGGAEVVVVAGGAVVVVVVGGLAHVTVSALGLVLAFMRFPGQLSEMLDPSAMDSEPSEFGAVAVWAAGIVATSATMSAPLVAIAAARMRGSRLRRFTIGATLVLSGTRPALDPSDTRPAPSVTHHFGRAPRGTLLPRQKFATRRGRPMLDARPQSTSCNGGARHL